MHSNIHKNTYDPATLSHFLWYRLKCHEASGTEFQCLFENIIKKSDIKFLSIKPYGKLGDKKCDGLFWFESESTVFQVYSPDNIKLAQVLRKINEDFAGAKKHWGKSLKKWVFVYNARNGVPADIPLLLQSVKKKNKKMKIDTLSNDELWDIARNLSVQQRSEILGAPIGSKKTSKSNIVIVQDVMSPISTSTVEDALKPTTIYGRPIYLRSGNELKWNEAAKYQEDTTNSLINKTKEHSLKYSVFSLAPIPLIIQLGFLISDRVEVRCFQFDRLKKSWKWPRENVDSKLHVTGIPEEKDNSSREVVIRISLSANVRKDQTTAVVKTAHEIDIFVDEPDILWLRTEKQLLNLQNKFYGVLKSIRKNLPKAKGIHIFYAGPTSGAFVIGQSINPRMNPPVHTYEYSRKDKPEYTKAITLI